MDSICFIAYHKCRAAKEPNYDIRIQLMYQQENTVNALVLTGYYSRVKHLLDKYAKNGEYLINTEVYPNLMVLEYVSPNDGFCDIKQDKILLKGDN